MHNDGRIGTLIHAADLHLGSPLYAVRNRFSEDEDDRDRAEELLSNVPKAFDNLVDITLEEQADILVLAGDIYDGAEQEYKLQETFVKGLEKLVEGGVNVFIVHGNHDPLIAKTPNDIPLPKEVVVFRNTDKAEIQKVKLKSGEVIEVAGISYKETKEKRHLARDFFNSEVLPVESPKTSIAVLHTNLSGSSDHADYAPSKIEDLKNAPIGYWALGHIHRRQYDKLDDSNDRRWWAYPGNLQGRSTKPSECEPKGCLVVPIHHDGFAEPYFRHCDTVRFGNISIPLDSEMREKIDDEDDLKEALNNALAEAINHFHQNEQESKPCIFSVELTGVTDNYIKLESWDEGKTLLSNFREYTRSAFPDCLIMKVKAKYYPLSNLEEQITNDSLVGSILEALESLSVQEYIDSSAMIQAGPLKDYRKKLKDIIQDDKSSLEQIEAEIKRILLTQIESQHHG